MTNPFPSIYHSLDSILNILKKPENLAVHGVTELLQIYEGAKENKKKSDASGDSRRHPFIVLEGLDGSGKSTVGFRFAKKINGIKWQTPPESIRHLRSLTDENRVLFSAYYSLGNYIAALEVQVALKDKPIVMDRYWHSTTAFGIAQAVNDNEDLQELPPKGDQVYCWPEDLFKPDVAIFLDVDESVRLQRLSRRKEFTAQENLLKSSPEFRNNVISAYKNMTNPEVIFVDGNNSFETECEELYAVVKPFLTD
ncbi:UMP-CMP kinase 2, mitochondrial-like isoform X2 [Diabrotica undecimpunctata]|uniref:UMP-CMP kinase 2, mitochondrial-like isoform X2 n=1 Tax=Diabrotica undecimpunctata TaxID=50387 RepID=UPI003B6356A6